jgi:hypothetical protein
LALSAIAASMLAVTPRVLPLISWENAKWPC